MSRTRLASLLAGQAACVVAMEAWATSHHRGRVAQAHGHAVRIVPAAYVTPLVKRQKNDRPDAEAIAAAATRPAMRFVTVKSAETRARAPSIGLEPVAPFRTAVPHAPVPRQAAPATDRRVVPKARLWRDGGIWPSSALWRRSDRPA